MLNRWTVILSILNVLVSFSWVDPLHDLLILTDDLHAHIEEGERTIIEVLDYDALKQTTDYIETSGFKQREVTVDHELYERELTGFLKETIEIEHLTSEQVFRMTYHLTGDVVKLFEHNRIRDEVNSFIGTIYTGARRDYACISLPEYDTLSGRHTLEKWIDEWDIIVDQKLIETDFFVVSGYTDRLQREIPTEHNKMNIQLASRIGASGDTTFTIGTPILTTEY
ncbi:YwmB family TATA-box binding protein [Pelagirhabdus alkalitolerans]|nr:YwmB family TATA-box binding protein [Pelagirhabdus alkalitolerans]